MDRNANPEGDAKVSRLERELSWCTELIKCLEYQRTIYRAHCGDCLTLKKTDNETRVTVDELTRLDAQISGLYREPEAKGHRKRALLAAKRKQSTQQRDNSPSDSVTPNKKLRASAAAASPLLAIDIKSGQQKSFESASSGNSLRTIVLPFVQPHQPSSSSSVPVTKPSIQNKKTFTCSVGKCTFHCESGKSLTRHQLEAHRRVAFLQIIEPHGLTLNEQYDIVRLKESGLEQGELLANLIANGCFFDDCPVHFPASSTLGAIISHLSTHQSQHLGLPCYHCLLYFANKQTLCDHLAANEACQQGNINSPNGGSCAFLSPAMVRRLRSSIIGGSKRSKPRFRCPLCVNSEAHFEETALAVHMAMMHPGEDHSRVEKSEEDTVLEGEEEIILLEDGRATLATTIEEVPDEETTQEEVPETSTPVQYEVIFEDQTTGYNPSSQEEGGDSGSAEYVLMDDTQVAQLLETGDYRIVSEDAGEEVPATEPEIEVIEVTQESMDELPPVADASTIAPVSRATSVLHSFIYECSHCTLAFNSENDLSRHMLLEHELASYECEECDFVSQDVALYRQHQLVHRQGAAMHSCRHCQLAFTSHYDLLAHRKLKHAQHQCYVCQEVFPSRILYTAHMVSFHRDRALQCSLCAYKTYVEELFERHGDNHLDYAYQCPVAKCGERFVSDYKLDAHVACRHKEEEGAFKCDQCTADYSKRHQLIRHRRKEHGLEPLPCSLCNFTCNSTVDLERHHMAHDIERSYRCVQCKTTFRTQAHLDSHLQHVHNQKLPCGTEGCTETFTSWKTLGKHKEEEHGPKEKVEEVVVPVVPVDEQEKAAKWKALQTYKRKTPTMKKGSGFTSLLKPKKADSDAHQLPEDALDPAASKLTDDLVLETPW